MANAFPRYANKNAGFNVNVPVSLLNPGRNTVTLRTYASNGAWNMILEREVFITNPPTAWKAALTCHLGKKAQYMLQDGLMIKTLINR